MYGVCTHDTDDNGSQCTDHVARVFKSTRHSQYSRAQAGLQEMYKSVEKSAEKKKNEHLNIPLVTVEPRENYGFRAYSRGGVFHVTVLVRIVEILLSVCLDGVGHDTLVETIHVNAAKWSQNDML